MAEKETVPLKRLVTLALTEKIAGPSAEDYLNARAKCGSQKKLMRALSKVADVEPQERDRL